MEVSEWKQLKDGDQVFVLDFKVDDIHVRQGKIVNTFADEICPMCGKKNYDYFSNKRILVDQIIYEYNMRYVYLTKEDAQAARKIELTKRIKSLQSEVNNMKIKLLETDNNIKKIKQKLQNDV